MPALKRTLQAIVASAVLTISCAPRHTYKPVEPTPITQPIATASPAPIAQPTTSPAPYKLPEIAQYAREKTEKIAGNTFSYRIRDDVLSLEADIKPGKDVNLVMVLYSPKGEEIEIIKRAVKKGELFNFELLRPVSRLRQEYGDEGYRAEFSVDGINLEYSFNLM